MTITEKILAQHAGKARVVPGETVWIDADCLLTHDVCGPGTFGIFRQQFGDKARVWDPDRVVVLPDHYIHTEDKHAIRNREQVRSFARDQALPHYFDESTDRYRGVCHVALAEAGFTRPGEVLFGTDSHTCTAGAFGMFATGVGNTDAAFILGTGRLWVKVPATRQVILEGEQPSFIMAKDVILSILGEIGIDGATYQTMSFAGDAVSAFNMDERMTLCNMVVEGGAKNGVIAPDQTTANFLRQRWDGTPEPVYNDPDARYASVTALRMQDLEPMVAEPFSPDKVTPARKLKSVALDQCYIGSCTGGKMADFRAAASILKGRTVAIRTVLVPATREVEAGLNHEMLHGVSLRSIFENAGCEIGLPSCAACLGGPPDTFGRLQGEEVCISTTNRNFPGRMGSPDSRTYLASPLTAAASAVRGVITDPRDVM